ncbi:sugar kinase, ribokinase [Halobacteroides halobius DSM 5150]|uniref:5-dehydro-2-deoxygluconokinase n=1 Tax=Halobacteroides halobius (strain ATCC 35273 / DSM 5150 / MD-1) TaxID=748449 RepID=L0KE92_HALHC|nr:5-dehydro-2-deoxygluconokinase [Halobacteroides halobius]AGB42383.1 sugar kinase, ribokinase [Halobacteroides halobius DSM 5150]
MNNLVFNEKKKRDFIAIGRIGVDLNANEIHRPMEETETFTKYVGGSPANISIGMARLGMDTGFIGKVSEDQFGNYILNYFEQDGIDTSNIVIDQEGAMTGLAFTEIKSPTDCSILMYRDNVADLKIDPQDIDEEYIRNSKVLQVSGTALSKSPSREAVFLAIDYARKHDTVVVFDIDYRPYSWRSEEETAIYYSLAAEKSDVIIGSREEFNIVESLTMPKNENDQATAQHWFDYNAQIVVVKHGKEGSTAYTKEGESYDIKPFPVEVVKTFGGGDAYASAFIYGLMQNWDIDKCLEFGSASAAMLVASHSCSDAMPTVEEIEVFIKEKKEEYGERVAST